VNIKMKSSLFFVVRNAIALGRSLVLFTTASFGGSIIHVAMKPNAERTAAIALVMGVFAFCLLLVLLAAQELMFVVRVPALVMEPLPSLLRMFPLSLAATGILALWVVVLTGRRDIWSRLLDAGESIHVRLGLAARWGRGFSESRAFMILVSVLFGLSALATVGIVAAYFYLKGIIL
jgi:hypothetical protein